LTTARRRELTCPHCGARMAVSVPALPYYLVNFGVSLFSGVGGVLFVFLWLMGKGAAAMWLALLLAALAVGSNVLLAHMASVTNLLDGVPGRRG
jgi:hypothetical protein